MLLPSGESSASVLTILLVEDFSGDSLGIILMLGIIVFVTSLLSLPMDLYCCCYCSMTTGLVICSRHHGCYIISPILILW